MAEKENINQKITPPQTQSQTNVTLAQAINNLNQRMGMVEIGTSKANANVDILNNRLDLLKKTIELLEKEIKFNEKTR